MSYKITDTVIVDQNKNINAIGIATFAGPVIIGGGSSTGTVSQPLQVTGANGAYIGGNVGIGSTNPSSKLWVGGDIYNTGIHTAQVLNASKDPGTGITTDFTNSLFGNGWRVSSPASTTYYKLATLPAGGGGNTFDHLTINGVLGAWTNGNQTPFEIIFSNRGAFNYKYTSYGSIRSDVKILGISTNSTIEIWAQHQASAFTKLVYNIPNSIESIVVSNPTSTTTVPTGTTVFDSSTAVPRFVINESDNVGINTTNPTSKLYVVGDGNFTGVVTANKFSGDGSLLTNLPSSGGGSSQWVTTSSGIHTLSNIGIGTTNPTTGVTIGGTTGISFANNNVRIGDVSTGSSITTGTHNNFIGASAGRFTTTGGHNNFFGFCAGLSNTTGSSNNFFGRYAGRNNTTGTYNNFFGSFAGRNNTTGSSNNFFGRYAGRYNTTGSNNNFFGCYSGRFLDGGCNNNFFGYAAGSSNSTGCNNNFFGYGAGRFCSGSNNNFFGRYAGLWNDSSHNNFFGYGSGLCAVYASNNNFFGYYAGRSSNSSSGIHNNFFGRCAGYCNYGGSYNNFFGSFSGFSNYNGSNNNFFGTSAGSSNTYGFHNNFFGHYAGLSNTTGCYNNFFGRYAGRLNTTGSDNIFFGRNAGCTNLTGSQNVVIGYNRNTPITSGNNQLVIGAGNTSWIVGNSSYNIGIGTTNPTEKLSLLGKIQIHQNSTSDNRIILRGQPGSSYRWNIDNYGSGNDFRIFREDDSTSANGSVAVSISTTGTVTATKFSGDGSLLTGISASGSGVVVQNQGSTVGTAGTINFSTNLTASFSSGTATVSLSNNPSISGILTADQVYTSNNGNGTNIRIGDDAWLGDINVANTTRLSGAQDSTKAFVVFGNSDSVALGRTGTGPLYYGGNFTVAGIITASSFSGNASSATYAGTAGIATNTIGGISSITQLQVTGISTFTNGPLLIGTATSTGTATQPLQVTGGAYVSGLFGIGTTNPTTRISIGGTTGISFVDTNVRIGDVSTGSSITYGAYNNFIGDSAGRFTTGGFYNNFFGRYVGCCNTFGNCNNFFGASAGRSNTTGSNNNFFGALAGRSNTTGSFNNFFGFCAGRSNTTGCYNNFFGNLAGYNNTTGCHNNFFGRSAGLINTTGCYNNFFGRCAGYYNTTGSSNNFFGRYAGYINSTGRYNNFFGSSAGRLNTTGGYNNFFGRYAGYSNTTGSDNIFFGRYAGCTNVTGSQNVVIGPTQNTPITSGSNQLVIGAGNTSWIVGNSSYNIGIGTTNPTSKLSVVGDGNFTGIITASQIDLTANATTDDSVLYLSGSVLGTQSKNGIIGIGQLGFSDTDIIANFAHNVNSYAQIVIQNKNSGNQASSDIVVNNDRTGGTTYYGDFGINGTTFSGGGPFGDPDGTYLYSSGGTLSVGTNDALDFRVATGSTSATPVTRLTVKGTSGNVGIGTTTPTEALQVQGNVSINGLVSYGTSVSTTTTVSQTTIHSGLSTSTYRSVEYTIQASQGTNYHVTKLLTVHDGTLAYNSEYGTIYNNGVVGTYDVDVSGGNIRLLVTPSSTSTTNYTINFIATKI